MSSDNLTQFIDLHYLQSKKFAEVELLLGIGRKELRQLWDSSTLERNAINRIKQIYNRKKIKEVSFPVFYKMYSAQGGKCHYCNITQEQITQLYASGKILKSQRTTRGQTLELERLQPDLSYDKIENLKLACYWCNNAKSDQFTDEEFKIVGRAIAEIWDKRLVE